MLRRRALAILNLHDLIVRTYDTNFIGLNKLKHFGALFSTVSSYTELPRKLKQSERKPWVTSITELKRRARLEKQERSVVREVTLSPPENGLLVKKLVPVAHEVLAARTELLACVSEVVNNTPIYSCR